MQITALLLIAFGFFLVGGVISLLRQGMRLFAVIVAVAAALALTAGVLRL